MGTRKAAAVRRLVRLVLFIFMATTERKSFRHDFALRNWSAPCKGHSRGRTPHRCRRAHTRAGTPLRSKSKTRDCLAEVLPFAFAAAGRRERRARAARASTRALAGWGRRVAPSSCLPSGPHGQCGSEPAAFCSSPRLRRRPHGRLVTGTAARGGG